MTLRLVLLVTVLLSNACTYTATTLTHVVHQSALAPAPTGPHAIGQQLARSKVGLEGGFAASAVGRTSATRDDGAAGQSVTTGALRGRISYGVTDWFEIGGDVEYRNASWNDRLASDLTANDEHRGHLVTGGPQLRFQFGRRLVRFGFSVEASFASLPYRWNVRRTLTTTEVEQGEVVSEFSRTSNFQDEGSVFYLFARFAGHLTLVFPKVAAQFGLMVHNQPVFFGRAEVSETCYDPGYCTGWDLEDLDKFDHTVMLTLFTSLSVKVLDRLALVGQMYVHAAGDDRLVSATRFGGDLAVRLIF